jgi:hypothetical protein
MSNLARSCVAECGCLFRAGRPPPRLGRRGGREMSWRATSYDAIVRQEYVIDIREHEVLLTFNGDEGAEAFIDWWRERGQREFKEYVTGEPSP